MTGTKPETHVFGSAAGIADFLFRFLAAKTAALGPGRYLDVALSGGKTPEKVYQALAGRKGLDWRRLRFFWGDERCVGPSSALSNYRAARLSLLAQAGVPRANIHRLRGEAAPRGEAARYSRLVKSLLPLSGGTPSFGLVLLGLGEDGHTASLFPGQARLFGSKELFAPAAGPAGGPGRITVTGRVLNAAENVFFMVTGAAKAAAVAAVLHGRGGSADLPAALVRPAGGRLVWLLDKAAASRLRGAAGFC
ncbi:MAG: 6-phosphogluconolactonase [Elusimicrobia bacterium]|nr:6-phosphogluconolactonase [Elusimicrobiota bacterium]